MDSYTNQLIIHTNPHKIYKALNTQHGLSNWWTKQTEIYPEVGGIATFHFGHNIYCVMKIGKLIPNKDIVWKCVEQYFTIKDSDKTDEWVGTMLHFFIQENSNGTITLSFLHDGLTPQLLCYTDCKNGWDYYLNSLKIYLETGKGNPYDNRNLTNENYIID